MLLGLAQILGQQLACAIVDKLAVAMLQRLASLAQRLQVAPAGAETAFRGLFEAHAGLQVFAQQLQAGAGARREGDGDVAVRAFLEANGLCGQIRLVADQGDLARFRSLVEELRP